MQTIQGTAAAWMLAIVILLAVSTVSAQPLRIYTAVELEFPTEEIRTASFRLRGWPPLLQGHSGSRQAGRRHVPESC